MTERRRRPSPRAVVVGSLALFATLLALLAYQLAIDPTFGATAASGRGQVRKVIERRVVTTVVPTPGESGISGESTSGSSYSPAPEPEPLTTGSS